MKLKITLLAVLFVMIYTCKDSTKATTEQLPTKDSTTNNVNNLKGIWKLTSLYNYKNNKVIDSFDSSKDSRQVKIYTDTKVMWCKHKPADSSEWFGYGTYKYEDNILTEVLDFGSAVMDDVIAEKKAFKFELILNSNNFQQIELDEDGNRIYSENYKRIERY